MLQRSCFDGSSPLTSQLLRDLDSCNSDPVAVASCFVERVRRTGSLPLAYLVGSSETGLSNTRRRMSLGDPSPGEGFGALPRMQGYSEVQLGLSG
jgi:hypothetical protein